MKIKRKKSHRRILMALLMQLFLFSLIFLLGKSLYHLVFLEEAKEIYPTTMPLVHTSTREKAVELLEVSNSYNKIVDHLVSPHAILVNLENQQILIDKESTEPIYPASLTKIMTALIAIEKLNYFDEKVFLSPDMFEELYNEDASMAGFLPGETVSAIDLLYGILLPSGAECCIGLSEYIAGSEDAFVTLMNEKAKSLDMMNTHFCNTTGLHDPEHYTTVADLTVLLEYALQEDTFREIFTSQKHVAQSSDLHPDGFTFHSTLFKNLDSPYLASGTILGGKTGYTSQAGLCLASLAVINNKEYIMITSGAEGNHLTEQYNITDALYAYNSLD